jgi:hypothetical protein
MILVDISFFIPHHAVLYDRFKKDRIIDLCIISDDCPVTVVGIQFTVSEGIVEVKKDRFDCHSSSRVYYSYILQAHRKIFSIKKHPEIPDA